MPTQRSFLGSFLAAFRVHSQPPIAKTSATTLSGPSSGAGSSATLWTATTAVSLSTATAEHSVTNPRPIHSKPNTYLPSAGTGIAPPPSATAATIQHNVSPQTHLGRSPSGPASPVYGPPNKPTPNYPTCQEVHGPRRRRRSSDSSSDSGRFGEARSAGGGEKFFIGGRTAGGEERYYKLSMVKRERSADRISADQLSL